MHNILVVSETASYLLTSIVMQLEEKEYKVISVSAETDAMMRVKAQLSAILIYASEELVDKMPGLVYIKDKAIEEDIPVFVIGDDDQINNIGASIPKHVIQQIFPRPINVKAVSDALDTYIRNEGKHNKRKILVVDDSGAMLRNVKGWLGDKYQVILANSGTMAIKYLALNQPDLVLLDYEMPVLDGKQVLEMIRSESEFSSIPVIFLTSKSDKDSVMQVMSLKPAGYLLKTMEPAQIIQAVDDFFERSKARF